MVQEQKKGPKGIIKASAYVEFYDDETKENYVLKKVLQRLSH